MNAWGSYESISQELRDHAARTVAARLGVPEHALFLRWSTRERVFWFESSSFSRLATIDADAGTIRYAARSSAVGAVQPLNYGGPVLWFPHSRVAVAMAEARRAEPEPEGYGFDTLNGGQRMRAAIRESFRQPLEPARDELHYTRGIGSGATHSRIEPEPAARRTETDGIHTWDAETGALLSRY